MTVLTQLAYTIFEISNLNLKKKQLKFSVTWYPMGVKISKRYSYYSFDSFSTKLFWTVKNGFADVIFHWVSWVKLLKKAFGKSLHIDEKSDWADILQKHAYGHSAGTVKKWFHWRHFLLSYLSKITQKSIREVLTHWRKVWLGWYTHQTCLGELYTPLSISHTDAIISCIFTTWRYM